MTLRLAEHLRLPIDVRELLMGKPVMYVIVRVAGLDEPPSEHAAPRPWTEPFPWTQGNPYTALVLPDPAAMRRMGLVTWVPGGPAGFRLRLLPYVANQPWVTAEHIRNNFPPEVVVDEDEDEGEDEGEDEDEDEADDNDDGDDTDDGQDRDERL